MVLKTKKWYKKGKNNKTRTKFLSLNTKTKLHSQIQNRISKNFANNKFQLANKIYTKYKGSVQKMDRFWLNLDEIHKNLIFRSNFQKLWYQSKRLLTSNKTQILNYVIKKKPTYMHKQNIQAEKDIPHKFFTKDQPMYLQNGKKSWFVAKRLRFIKIKKINKNFKFFGDFWRKYKGLCQTNDFLNIRGRYEINKLFHFEINENRIPSWAYKAFFPFYYLPWYRKKTFFKLSNFLYKKNPWLNPLYNTRQLYRLMRRRRCHRDKLPHKIRRVFYYNKFFRLMHPRFRAPYGRNSFMFYKILRRYIILPYLGKWTAKQLETLVKKIKRAYHVRSGHNFQANFENRLDILAYKMNFAPTIFWSRVFIALGWIWVSKRQDKESMRLSNMLMRDSVIPISLEKNRNIGFIKKKSMLKVKLLLDLKNKWNKNERYISNLDSFKNEELINQEQQLDPSYILKSDEIIQVSPFLIKILSKYFMNKLRKKRISLHITDNHEKNAGILLPFRRSCVLNEDRLKPQYWNPTYLNKAR